MNHNNNIIIPVLIFAFSLIFLLPACTKQKENTEREAIAVKVIVAENNKTIVNYTYIGKIEENHSLSLGFQLGGKINNIYKKKGDYVKKGDILASIDNTQQQNALKTAQANLQRAQDAYQRLEKVHNQGALPEIKWVEMQTELDKAQATYSMALKQLNDCVLRSPQNGIIEESNICIGQQMLPNQTAFQLINTDVLKAAFSVPETEITNINIGDEITILLPALNNITLTAKITEKALTANPISHAYNIGADLSDVNKNLLPDMMCKVSLQNSEIQGIIVPATCVQLRLDSHSIWIVKNASAHRVNIKPSVFVGNNVLIEEGLTQGDTIITQGWQKLWEGAKIEINS